METKRDTGSIVRRPNLQGCDVLGCKGIPNADGWCKDHETESSREGLVVRHHGSTGP